MFLYRENELDVLESDFLNPNASFNFIFGRKKVGKTTLINEYIKDKDTLYLNCFEILPNLLISTFKKSIDSFFQVETKTKLDNFDDLFLYLSKQNIESKMVIVLENINNILKIDKSFILNFYSYWNKYLKNKNIQFILSSSFFPSNKDEMNIFKKANNIIKLKSLPYKIIKDLFPNIKEKNQIYIYSTFGTNIQYLKFYDENKDVFTNLKEICLSYDSLVFNEGMNIVKTDLNEAVTYSSILYAISMGNKKIGDIASFLELKSSYLTRYLQKLVELMILEKVVPVNENPQKSKFGRYEIEDNFLKFWFCYIYPNFNLLLKNEYDTVLKFIEDDFEKRLVCDAYKKSLMEQLKDNEESFFGFIPNKIGAWWNNKETEIDIIAYNSKNIVFVDTNWQNKKDEKLLYNVLLKKSLNFKTPLIKNYMIFPNDL